MVSFLNDLTSSYEASKKLNAVLLEELQTLHLKTIDTQIQITNIENEEEEQERFGNDVTILSPKQEPFDEELSFIENNFRTDHSVNENISPPKTNDGVAETNAEEEVADNHFSYEIEDMEFCETLIEEDKEDITNHDFEIEGDEKQ